jgi:RHS repeat-associated protein
LQRRAYDYNCDGLVTGIDDLLGGTRTIGLDRGGRVTAVQGPDWAEEYTYDPAGNVAAASWPSGVAAALGGSGSREITGTLITRAGNVRYRHDRQGRVVQRQVTRMSRKPDVWQYQWDASDRLVAVTTPDRTSWRYRYDPFGRRIAKQRLGPGGEVVEQTDFTWDGPVLAEQSSSMVAGRSGRVVTWNYRPGSFTPLTQAEHIPACDLSPAGDLSGASQEQIDQRFYAIVCDLIGSPAELATPDGTLAGHQQHTLWGTTAWRGEATTPLRFPGQYADPETGLHYNQHRYYDPVVGAYLTPDPLGLAAAPNPHSYVVNPQVLSDPLGLAPYDATQPGTDIVPYSPDFALGQLTRNGDAGASDLMRSGQDQGWTVSKSPAGPSKFSDESGITRLTIKHGSPRAPGSNLPHIEVRDPTGQRIDPFGNPVTRNSPSNHVPITWDLP